MKLFVYLGRYVPYNQNLVHYLELLDHKYSTTPFVEFLVYYNEIVRHSVFLIEADKNDLSKIVTLTLRLHQFIKRCQYKMCKYLYPPTNPTLLSLEPIDTVKDFVDFGGGPIYHRLSLFELSNIITASLSLQQNGFFEPKMPCNPYNKIPFTYNQLVLIYCTMQSRGRKISTLMRFFKCAQFNIKQFTELFRSYLTRLAAKNFILSMSDPEWNYTLKRMLDRFFFTHETCLECMILREDKHILFDKILTLFFYESNQRIPIDSQRYASKIHKIFTQYNLYHHNYYHYKSHPTPFFERHVSGVDINSTQFPLEEDIPPLFTAPENNDMEPQNSVNVVEQDEDQDEDEDHAQVLEEISDQPQVLRRRRSNSVENSMEVEEDVHLDQPLSSLLNLDVDN